MKKTYLARIVVHFTAEVEAEEGQEDQAVTELGEAINREIGDGFFEQVKSRYGLKARAEYISAGVMETLIEGEAP